MILMIGVRLSLLWLLSRMYMGFLAARGFARIGTDLFWPIYCAATIGDMRPTVA